MIVALPLSSTSTFVPSGNLSLFAFSILSLTSSFSLSVKLFGSFTPVLSGTFGSTLSAIVLSPVLAFSFIVCSGVKVFVDPSG